MQGKPIHIILFFLIILSGCNKTVSEIGSGFVTSEPFDVALIDTVTFRTSTVIFDSLNTTGLARLLVGFHDDAKLGPVTSASIFQVSPPFTSSLDPNNTTYTALSLHLIRDGYSFYDTTQVQTLYVYQLTAPIPLNGGGHYNVDKFSIDRTKPLGSLTFLPAPHKKDSVEIFLSDDLGRQLMRMAQSGDPNLSSVDNFNKFFNGLVLMPDTLNSRSILGFAASKLQMRLYYHDNAIAPPQNPNKYLSFTTAQGGVYYNRTYGDRSATKLAALHTSTDILPSSKTDQMIYLQGGTGLAMRIEFPYIKNLFFVQSTFQCTKAILRMIPVRTYYDFTSLPPPQLTLGIVDLENRIQVNGYIQAGLFTDPLGNASYNIDVTNFVNAQLLTETNNNNALLLQLPDPGFRSTISRLYVGDGHNVDYQMKLTVYYIILSGQ